MAAENRIEAVKKVSQALKEELSNKPQQIEELERLPPNKEHFQSLLDNAAKGAVPAQRLDGTVAATDGVQHLENNPIFSDEKVTAQKSGSATDQESKKKQNAEVEEIEGVGSAKSEKLNPSSLMEEVKKLNGQVSKASQMTPEELKNQSQNLIAQIDEIKTQLSQAPGTIKPSYQTLLRNRLTHIDDTLKIALSKAGVEYTPPPAQVQNQGTLNPIERFIGFLSNSQYQLEHLSSTIEQLNVTKAQLTPANMLALQIKVGYVQQQIELFTSLLNKALESTKTIMNVQV